MTLSLIISQVNTFHKTTHSSAITCFLLQTSTGRRNVYSRWGEIIHYTFMFGNSEMEISAPSFPWSTNIRTWRCVAHSSTLYTHSLSIQMNTRHLNCKPSMLNEWSGSGFGWNILLGFVCFDCFIFNFSQIALVWGCRWAASVWKQWPG